jgi:large subunit ribosomal protein L21
MYAIVETGGRQYRVSPGDRVDVEKLAGEVGETVMLTDVLMLGEGAAVTVGTPKIALARVEAKITAQKRGKKIIVFKFKRRKNFRKKRGHRQSLTSLSIIGIHTETPEVAAAVEAEASPAAVLPEAMEAEPSYAAVVPEAMEAEPSSAEDVEQPVR